MGKREDHATLLEQAHQLLQPVSMTSVRPAQCIDPALTLARQCHREMTYLPARYRSQLRVNTLRLQHVLNALRADRSVTTADYAAVQQAATTFHEVATATRNVGRPPRTAASIPSSSVGLRFSSMAELADAHPFVVVHDGRPVESASIDLHGLGDLDAHRSSLPSLGRDQPFAVYRCPLVVYTQTGVSGSALDRAGLTWRRLSGGAPPVVVGLSRVSREGVPALLLENQLLVGLDRRRLSTDRDQYVRQVTDQLQHRLGPLTAPLGERARLLISPGNPLSWLWLVPSRVMTVARLHVVEAAFPWSTEEVHMSDRERDAAKREVERIDQQIDVLRKQGRDIDVNALARQNELLERLDRSQHRPGSGAPDLAQRRAAMQEAIDKRVRPIRSRISGLREQLEGLPRTMPLARELRADIKRLEAHVKAVTDEEMLRARNALRTV